MTVTVLVPIQIQLSQTTEGRAASPQLRMVFVGVCIISIETPLHTGHRFHRPIFLHMLNIITPDTQLICATSESRRDPCAPEDDLAQVHSKLAVHMSARIMLLMAQALDPAYVQSTSL